MSQSDALKALISIVRVDYDRFLADAGALQVFSQAFIEAGLDDPIWIANQTGRYLQQSDLRFSGWALLRHLTALWRTYKAVGKEEFERLEGLPRRG